MRTLRAATLLALVAILAAAGGRAGLALGAEPVTIEAAPDGEGGWRLAARVIADDGRPQSQVAVTFTVATDFFGDRWVPIGSAVTDTSGVATLAYRPSWNGEQVVVARVSGGENVASSPLALDVTGALPAIPPEPADLPIVRAWAIPIGAGVVVAVWIALAFIFLSALIGIARGGAEPAGHSLTPASTAGSPPELTQRRDAT